MNQIDLQCTSFLLTTSHSDCAWPVISSKWHQAGRHVFCCDTNSMPMSIQVSIEEQWIVSRRKICAHCARLACRRVYRQLRGTGRVLDQHRHTPVSYYEYDIAIDRKLEAGCEPQSALSRLPADLKSNTILRLTIVKTFSRVQPNNLNLNRHNILHT